ncbi:MULTISPECIES: hypothetical protein [Streptomyces]|uniref:Integral membrane protein n=1 Tax=Streptomyces sanyensis TaxID=568869 RepID=A0ABP9BHE9_9ACTN
MKDAAERTRAWPREEDEQWAARVEMRLALDLQAPDGLADLVLDEVHEAVTETGLDARELFGPPDEYARTAVEEHVGEEQRARVDVKGMAPGQRFTASLATFCGIGILLGLMHWFREGLWMAPGPAALAALAGIALAGLLAVCALTAWSAGRIRGAAGLAAAGAAAVGAAVAAASLLPEDPRVTLPAPAAAAVCAVLAVLAANLPAAAVERCFVPAPRPGDDGHWLSRLEGVLRGRHALSAAEARGHVREARRHLEASGEDAATAFGDVEVYALRLAAGPRRAARVERRELYGATAIAAVLALLLVEKVRNPEPGSVWFWCSLAVALVWITHAIRLWLRAAATRNRRGGRA